MPGAGPLPVTFENPPGLYGSEDGVFAHNLLNAASTFAPLVRPQINVPITTVRYAFDESRNLKGLLVAAALALMVLDTLAVFWMGGLFSRRPRRARAAATAAALLIALGPLFGHADTASGTKSTELRSASVEDI